MLPILSSELAAALLARGHAVRLRAGGGSMRPWIRPHSVVTLRPVGDPATLRVGMVILALCDGRPMLHRIVRTAPALRTKGDALGHLDPSPYAVLGCLEGSGGWRDRAIARVSLALLPAQSRLIRLCCALRSGRRAISFLTHHPRSERIRNPPVPDNGGAGEVAPDPLLLVLPKRKDPVSEAEE